MTKKLLRCPNCNNKMVIILYDEPNEILEKYVYDKKFFFRGLEERSIDRNGPNRIRYHCYNCNRSYSENLEKYVIDDKDSYQIMEDTKREINRLIDELANDVIANLDNDTKKELQKIPEYDHFAFGLYIRNNYIYHNKKAKYRIDPDELSHRIYNKIIEKITK